MKQYWDCQIYSTYACMQNDDVDCTSQNFRILFRFRLNWPCMTKKGYLFETMDNRAIKDNIDQTMRTRNFRARNEIVERGATSQRFKKERMPTSRETCENAFSGKQIDKVPMETHAVSPMILHLETDARLREEKGNFLLLP